MKGEKRRETKTDYYVIRKRYKKKVHFTRRITQQPKQGTPLCTIPPLPHRRDGLPEPII